MADRAAFVSKLRISVTCVMTVLVAAVTTFGTPVASAMTSDDQKCMLNNTCQYEAGDTCNDTGSDDLYSGLTGSDPIEKGYNFFISAQGGGLSAIQAAAVAGNLMDESHFDPTIMQAGGNSKDPSDADPLGWGIAQWTPGSKITGIASDLGVNGAIYKLSTQLQIVYKEMTGTSPVGAKNMMKGLRAINDLPTAVEYFRTQFEGGIPGSRLTDAQQILQQYGNNQPSSDGTGSGDTSSAAASAADGSSGCDNGNNSGGSINGSGSGNFTTDKSKSYPGLQEMLKNVQGAAEPNENKTGPKTISNLTICGSTTCKGTCMHTVAALWGYPHSGYHSPYLSGADGPGMWPYFSGTSHEHPGSRNVPVGALLIYSGDPGHVVIYLGNNLIVSTDTGPDGSWDEGGGIHVVSADSIEKKWGMTYLGWVDPVFGGHLGYGSVHY